MFLKSIARPKCQADRRLSPCPALPAAQRPYSALLLEPYSSPKDKFGWAAVSAGQIGTILSAMSSADARRLCKLLSSSGSPR
jgi:hypothetical protein